MEITQESPTQLSLAIRLCSLALCSDLQIASSLTPNLVTTFTCYPSLHSACSYDSIYALEISLRCVISNGVMSSNYGAATKPRASCGARHKVVLLGTRWYRGF